MNKQEVLKSLCYNVNEYRSIILPSPAHQPRRGCVGAILRWRRHRTDIPISSQPIHTIEEFFNQDWVREDTEGEAELLFMRRATRIGDRWSGHVAFPGGKNEKQETDRETAEREVLEEIGIDLNGGAFIPIGRLDDREIVSVRQNKLLMILVPFVYLQVVPETPKLSLSEAEVAAVQWVPLSYFLSDSFPYQPITEELTLGHTQSRTKDFIIRCLFGSVCFPSFSLPTTGNSFKLWGLTMNITADLIDLTTHKQLPFTRMARSDPQYTRPDIGWCITLITKAIMTYKAYCTNENKSSLWYRTEWDKTYFSSIRKAIITAMVLRLGAVTMILFTLYKHSTSMNIN